MALLCPYERNDSKKKIHLNHDNNCTSMYLKGFLIKKATFFGSSVLQVYREQFLDYFFVVTDNLRHCFYIITSLKDVA